MGTIALVVRAALVGAVLALAAGLALARCDTGRPGSPFTQQARVSTIAPCTLAYGMCQVTEYIHHRANGTVWIETCFEEPPVTEGHGNVRVAVVDCYHP